MNKITNAVNVLQRFTENENLRSVLDEVRELLLEENQTNIEALCPVGSFDIEERDISDLEYAFDYEVVTGSYCVDGTNYSEDARDTIMDRLDALFDKIDSHISDLEARLPENEEDEKYDKIQGRIEEWENTRDRIQAEWDDFDDADYEPDEVMWNIVFGYSCINTELAQRLGLAVVDIQGDEFLALTGCGMDLSPLFIAYEALEYGYVSEHYARKLYRETDYCRHVMGEKVFNEVMEKLGVSHIVEAAVEKNNQRMKEFDEAMNALAKARDAGQDKNITALQAVSVFLKFRD